MGSLGMGVGSGDDSIPSTSATVTAFRLDTLCMPNTPHSYLNHDIKHHDDIHTLIFSKVSPAPDVV